jgi:hypothetical protein
MINIMTTSVTHVIKIKITRDDKISRFFPDMPRAYLLCIFLMPTSLSKVSVRGVYCDNVALVLFSNELFILGHNSPLDKTFKYNADQTKLDS